MSYRGIIKNSKSPGEQAPMEYPQSTAGSGYNYYTTSSFSTGSGAQQIFDGTYTASISTHQQQLTPSKPLSDLNVELLARAIAEKSKLGLLGGPSDTSRPSAALAALQCYEDGRLSPPPALPPALPPQTVSSSPSPQPSISPLTNIFSPQSSASEKDKFWKTLLTYAIEGGKVESPFLEDRLRSFSPTSASSDHLSDSKKLMHEEDTVAKENNANAPLQFRNIDDEDEFLYGESDAAPNGEECPPKLVRESPSTVKSSLGEWSGDDSDSQVFKANISALNALTQLGEDFSPRLSPNYCRGQSELVSRPLAKNQISINLNLPQSISKESSEWEEPDEVVNTHNKNSSLKLTPSAGLVKGMCAQKNSDSSPKQKILDSNSGKKELKSGTNELLKYFTTKDKISIPREPKPQSSMLQTMAKAAATTSFQKPKDSLQSMQLKSHESSCKEKESSSSGDKKSVNSQSIKLVPHQVRKKLPQGSLSIKSSNSVKISKADVKGKPIRKEDIFAIDGERKSLLEGHKKSSLLTKEKHSKEVARPSKTKEPERSIDKRPKAYKSETYETRTVHLKSKHESETDRKDDLRKKITAIMKSKRERSRSPTYHSKSKSTNLSPSRDKTYRSYEMDRYSPRYKSSRRRSHEESPGKYNHDSPRSYHSREDSARDDFYSRKRRRSSRSPKRRSPTGYWDEGSPRKDSYDRLSGPWSRSRSPSDDFERHARRYSDERSPGLHKYRKTLRIPSEDTYLSDDSRGSPVTHASERSSKSHGCDYYGKKDSSRRSRRDLYDKLSHEERKAHSPSSRKGHGDFSERNIKENNRTKEEAILESMHSPINSPEKIDDIEGSPKHREQNIEAPSTVEKQASSEPSELAEFFRRLEQNKKVANTIQMMDTHSFNVSCNNSTTSPSPASAVLAETSNTIMQTPAHSQPSRFSTEVSPSLYAPSYSYCAPTLQSTSQQYSNVDLSYSTSNMPPQYPPSIPPFNPYVAPPPPPQFYSPGPYYMPHHPPPPVSQPDVNSSVGMGEISPNVLSEMITKASFKTLKKAVTRVRSLKEIPVVSRSSEKQISEVSDDAPSASVPVVKGETASTAVPEANPPEIPPEVSSPKDDDGKQSTEVHQNKLEIYKKLIDHRSQVKFEIQELTVKVERYRKLQSDYKKKNGRYNLSLKQFTERAEMELTQLIEKGKKLGAKLAKMKDKINSDRGSSPAQDVNKEKLEEVKPKLECEVKYFFYDSGNHWCQLCNEVFQTLPQKLEHLLTPKHKQLMDPYQRPWSAPVKEETQTRKTGVIKKRQAMKGSEFIVPIEGFFCSICKESFPDELHAEHHLKSLSHYEKYKEFVAENSEYERRYNEAMLAGVSVLESERKRKMTEDMKALVSKRRRNKEDDDDKHKDSKKTLAQEESGKKDEVEKLGSKKTKGVTLRFSGVKGKAPVEKKTGIPAAKSSSSTSKTDHKVVYIGKAPNYWSRIAAKSDKNTKKESPSKKYDDKTPSKTDLSTSRKTSSSDLPKASGSSKDQQVKEKVFNTYGQKILDESEINEEARKGISNTKAGDLGSKTHYKKSVSLKNVERDLNKGTPLNGSTSANVSESKSGNVKAQNSRNSSSASNPADSTSSLASKADSRAKTAVDKAIKNILYGEKAAVIPLNEINLPEVPKETEATTNTSDMQKVALTPQKEALVKVVLTEEEKDFLLLGINKDDMKPLAVPKRPPDPAFSSQAGAPLPAFTCQVEPMDLDPPDPSEAAVYVNFPSLNPSVSLNASAISAVPSQAVPTNVLSNSAQQPSGVISTSIANVGISAVGMAVSSKQELTPMNVPPSVCNSNILRDNIPPFPPPLQVPPPNVVIRAHTPDVIQPPIVPSSPTVNVGYGSGIPGGISAAAATALNSYPPPMQISPSTVGGISVAPCPHNQVPEFSLSGQHNMYSQSLEFTNISGTTTESTFDAVYQALLQGARPPHGTNFTFQCPEKYYDRRPIGPPRLELSYSTNNITIMDHSPYKLRKPFPPHPRPAGTFKSFVAKKNASGPAKSPGSLKVLDADGKDVPKDAKDMPEAADSVKSSSAISTTTEVKVKCDTDNQKSDGMVQAATDVQNKKNQEETSLSLQQAAFGRDSESGKSNNILDSDTSGASFTSDSKVELTIQNPNAVTSHNTKTERKGETIVSSSEVSIPVKGDVEEKGEVISSVLKEADCSGILDSTTSQMDDTPSIEAKYNKKTQNSTAVDNTEESLHAVAMVTEENVEHTVSSMLKVLIANAEGVNKTTVPCSKSEKGELEASVHPTAETVDHPVKGSKIQDTLQHEALDVVPGSDTMPELTAQTSDLSSCDYESEKKDQNDYSGSELSNDIPVLTRDYLVEEKEEASPSIAEDLVPCTSASNVPMEVTNIPTHVTGETEQRTQDFVGVSSPNTVTVIQEVEQPTKIAENDRRNAVLVPENHFVQDKEAMVSSVVEGRDQSAVLVATDEAMDISLSSDVHSAQKIENLGTMDNFFSATSAVVTSKEVEARETDNKIASSEDHLVSGNEDENEELFPIDHSLITSSACSPSDNEASVDFHASNVVNHPNVEMSEDVGDSISDSDDKIRNITLSADSPSDTTSVTDIKLENIVIVSKIDEEVTSANKGDFSQVKEKELLIHKEANAAEEFSMCDASYGKTDVNSSVSVKSNSSLQLSGSSDYVDSLILSQVNRNVENVKSSCEIPPMTDATVVQDDKQEFQSSSQNDESDGSTPMSASYVKKVGDIVCVPPGNTAVTSEKTSLISNIAISSRYDTLICQDDSDITARDDTVVGTESCLTDGPVKHLECSEKGFEEESVATEVAATIEHVPFSEPMISEDVRKTDDTVKADQVSLSFEKTECNSEFADSIMLVDTNNVPAPLDSNDKCVNSSVMENEICEENKQMSNVDSLELNSENDRCSDLGLSAEPGFEAEDQSISSKFIAVEHEPCSKAVISGDNRKIDGTIKYDTCHLTLETDTNDTVIPTTTNIYQQHTDERPDSIMLEEAHNALATTETDEECAIITLTKNESHEGKQQLSRIGFTEINAQGGRCPEFELSAEAGKTEENIEIKKENASYIEDKCTLSQTESKDVNEEYSGLGTAKMIEEIAEDQANHEEAALDEGQTTPSCMPTIHSYDDKDETNKDNSEEPPLLELAEPTETKLGSAQEDDNEVEVITLDTSDVQESDEGLMECDEKKPVLEKPIPKGRKNKKVVKTCKKTKRRRMTTRSMKKGNIPGESSVTQAVKEDEKMDDDTDEYECSDKD